MSTTVEAPTPAPADDSHLIGNRPEDALIREASDRIRAERLAEDVDRTAKHIIGLRELREKSGPDGLQYVSDERVIESLVDQVYGTKHNGNQVYDHRTGKPVTAPSGAQETFTALVEGRIGAIKHEAELARQAAEAKPSKSGGRLARGLSKLRERVGRGRRS